MAEMFVIVCSEIWSVSEVLNRRRQCHGLQPTAKAMAKIKAFNSDLGNLRVHPDHEVLKMCQRIFTFVT